MQLPMHRGPFPPHPQVPDAGIVLFNRVHVCVCRMCVRDPPERMPSLSNCYDPDTVMCRLHVFSFEDVGPEEGSVCQGLLVVGGAQIHNQRLVATTDRGPPHTLHLREKPPADLPASCTVVPSAETTLIKEFLVVSFD